MKSNYYKKKGLTRVAVVLTRKEHKFLHELAYRRNMSMARVIFECIVDQTGMNGKKKT